MIRTQFLERKGARRERVAGVSRVFDAVEGSGERAPVERNEAQRQRESEHAQEDQQIRAMFGCDGHASREVYEGRPRVGGSNRPAMAASTVLVAIDVASVARQEWPTGFLLYYYIKIPILFSS